MRHAVTIVAVVVASGLAARREDLATVVAVPVVLLAMLLVLAALTGGYFVQAVTSSAGRPAAVALVVASIVVYVLSLFVVASPAWRYGVVWALSSHAMVCVLATGKAPAYVWVLLLLYGGWLLVACGLPSLASRGVLGAIGDCARHYGSAAGGACNDGWLAYVRIVSIVNLALTGLQIVTAFVVGHGPAVAVHVAPVHAAPIQPVAVHASPVQSAPILPAPVQPAPVAERVVEL